MAKKPTANTFRTLENTLKEDQVSDKVYHCFERDPQLTYLRVVKPRLL